MKKKRKIKPRGIFITDDKTYHVISLQPRLIVEQKGRKSLTLKNMSDCEFILSLKLNGEHLDHYVIAKNSQKVLMDEAANKEYWCRSRENRPYELIMITQEVSS